ncbi:MAG: response regulator, partial [Lachnospiraceae bacterium]|nr:response regulator [Lachnospiraceae bacterium]
MHYNCLIVDDEEELSKMTAEYFNMFDVSTAVVSSKAECFDFLQKNDVDLILLDINLGDG